MKRPAFLLVILFVGCVRAEPNCTERRCLAQMLINKEYYSQPQYENCTLPIEVPFIEYQTLAVDTKNLRLNSRLVAAVEWLDPALAWDMSVYKFDRVVLPVKKIWTPQLHVTNGITTSMKHASDDLVVFSNGRVVHRVIINAEVNCEVNLFNYPFAGDECPVAIQTFSTGDCGTGLRLGDVRMIDGSHGDWQTDFATLKKQRDDRNYITVGLSIKYSNPFITLLLPSILIVLADLVSFALPLRGGERNTFKVTLALSFTMFLNILNNELPGDSQCSPIIRTHFCICLILLVLSMLVSMMLTGVAKDGLLIFNCFSKCSARRDKGNSDENKDEEIKADISVVHLDVSEDIQMLRKVVKFLEALDTKKQKHAKYEKIANRGDKIFFWFYFFVASSYITAMTCVMVKYKCKVNHFDFWY
ncbi:zinc-activated ligand-gated ion channel-like [Kryptolebias marmoratus]|uniref:zinc-activated ligand-gated ion channel-like n=1 Tax=Kryptolebias marmoratus TaxID=37003 RepID=UPI0007F8DC1D|nr:zinc-activated ligand-gated ion channel-like [Kryptolebias marmoratus]